MSAVGAALAVLAAIVLSGWVVRIYRRREIPVPGRAALAALRVAAVLLVLLLLLDPPLPGAAGPAGGPGVLLDASLSMGDGPGSPWARALDSLPAEGARVLRFGGDRPGAEAPSPGRAAAAGPEAAAPAVGRFTSSRLTPALEQAAELGAERVVVVSDLRLEDAPSAVAAARRLGVAVDVVDVGGPVRSAAVADVRVPGAARAGAPLPAEVEVAATAEAAGDSATLEIRQEERLVASRPLVLPDPGRRTRVELELPPPDAEGAVRYEARVLLDGDAWPDDDARSAWTEVDPEEGSLVLLSVEPDWEPRFLLPVLGSVTGLRTRGLLRAGPDRWLVMEPSGAAGTVDDARARREAEGAEMLVVQGGGEAGPEWMWEAAERAPRVVVLASGPADAARAGVETGGAVPGEWYPAPDVPASPLAAELSGAPLEGLPPLGPLLPLRSEGDVVPLRLRRGAAGSSSEAALVLRSEPGRRVAVTLAPGHWRWAFRAGPDADAYRRLWAGIAGWLLAETAAAGPGLRPSERVVARGDAPGWVAGGEAGDTVSLSLRVLPGDSVVLDTTVAVPAGRRFSTPPLAPGLYAWRASTAAGDAAGRLEVEAWTPELLHPRADGLEAPPGGRVAASRAGRPLRTHPLPYLVLLGLLSAEWIARRRKGLR